MNTQINIIESIDKIAPDNQEGFDFILSLTEQERSELLLMWKQQKY